MITDRDTGRSKGFGFVEMDTEAEAQAAIQGLHDQEYDGRRLTVNEAKPREPRSGGGGGGGGRGGYGGGGGGGAVVAMVVVAAAGGAIDRIDTRRGKNREPCLRAPGSTCYSSLGRDDRRLVLCFSDWEQQRCP